MTTESPNSSWHPALMPDHEDPAPAVDTTRKDSSDASPDSLHNGTPLESEPEPHSLDFTADDGGDIDAWLSKDDGDEGGARLASEQAAARAADAAEAPAAAAQGEGSHTTDAATRSTSRSGSQHASSMSFARTVSHEVSLGDDDEGEWSLSRSEADPFKFMPPSDRTNSFPAVPPVTSNAGGHEDQPLPSNQALDVLEETEKDWDLDEQPNQEEAENAQVPQPSPSGPEPSHSQHAPSRSMGGDVQAFEGQVSSTRYEEGVPLIPHSDNHAEGFPGTGEQPETGPFAGDDANDDFFSKITDSPQHVSANDTDIQALERKSTSQVLGSLEPEPPTREDTFGAINEVDETAPAPNSTTEMPKTSARKGGHKRTRTEDLRAKWQEAFDDDDDFLLDDSVTEDQDVNSTAFLGSDDEGLLDDNEGSAPAPRSAAAPSQPTSRQTSGSNPYAPQNAYQPTPLPYQAPQPPSQDPPGAYYKPPAPANAFGSAPQYIQPPAPGADQPRAQSFVDKSKGGYSSPFDLPPDIAGSVPKPRKRTSTQHLYTPAAPAQAPPQAPPQPAASASMAAPGPPPSNSRPSSSHGSQGPPPSAQKTSAPPPLRNKGSSFFEELPTTSKPRPTSKHSNRAPSPVRQSPPGPPLGPSPLGPSTGSQPTSRPGSSSDQIAPPSNLVAPERVSPYAALQSGASPVPPPSGNASKYSPAPAQAPGNAAPPPATGNRYSPASSGATRQPSYSPNSASNTTPPVLPHQPRTSSPLAHFETHTGKPYGDVSLRERRSSSSSYDPRLNRVPSLPPTREVEEEDDQSGAGVSLMGTRHSSAESKYVPTPGSRQTPPPPAPHAGQTLSPPKKSNSNYIPQPPPTSQPGFVPPPRAQTQSPGATRGDKSASQASGHARRPSSAHSHAPPEMTRLSQPAYASHSRTRGQSLTMSMIPPTDGREQDPLQRWKGVPIVAWGVGGTVITSFPKSIPRYNMGSSTPTISRAPGEVKVSSIKEVEPLPERLAKFPGPLKGKSKKKETIAWLASGIETLEKDLPDVSFHSNLSLEAKRGIERLLLWKVLRVFIEHDGVLEGNPGVEKAVRDILSPQMETSISNDGSFPGDPRMGQPGATATPMQSDAVDAETMDSVRVSLVKGDREAAVWTAVDKRLWGHAMLIAHTVSPDLYKRVSQEFVRKEVNYAGLSNEPMAALYKILSGNFDDCVDELVPSHARAGFQLVSTDAASGPAKGATDGLDKWRETLTLVLSNRSPEDVRGLHALGGLLASYGRAEAAHICFMFSRNVSVFGGFDDPNANFVLLGSDHRQQASHFSKDTEALQLSEVYEYGLSLAGGVAATGGAPHLAAYKLQHAVTLAEYGYRDRALQYCDAIVAAMSGQTKRSPYYNAYLVASVDDFMARLKQAPKGESGSWMSKPNMNKVSDSMWNKFNKFVSGDDGEGSGPNGTGNADSPFMHIGTTPTISRSSSVNNFETYGSAAPGYVPAPPPVPLVPSKYAPAAAQPAGTSNPYQPTSQYPPSGTPMDKGPSEYPGYPGIASESTYPSPGSIQNGPYAPVSGYHPTGPDSAPPASSPAVDGYQPRGLQESASMPALSAAQRQDTVGLGYSPPSFGYEPPQMNITAPDPESNENVEENGAGGYEPPSYQPYGYEPPSYEPDPEPSVEDGTGSPKKKKSFMDDDEDDIPGLRPQGKSKADKDRENEELFRKAAEEDDKRAAEAKSSKKGWGFGSWFTKKSESPKPGELPNKPVKANLGEASSFVYDPELKRWINKKPGAENPEPKKATPPPPKAGPRSVSGETPPPPSGTPPPSTGARSTSGGPPPRSVPIPVPNSGLTKATSQESLNVPMGASMSRSVSNNSATGPPSAPSSRPGTATSNASSIDDLLSTSGPRKAGQKKPRKSGRYVDVMAKS